METKTTLEEFLWDGHFSEEQYDILKSCSDSGSTKDWILYRRKNRKTPITLEGANFEDFNLSKIDLKNANLKDASLCRSILKQTMFMNANLNSVKFDGANMSGAKFIAADMTHARMTSIIAIDTVFRFAKLQHSDFHEAVVNGSIFDRADLSNSVFHAADISKCSFKYSNLKSTIITESKMLSTEFDVAIIDGTTLIWDCAFDLKTNFTGVGISDARIEPQLKSRFDTNIRRIWWIKNIKNRKEVLGSFVNVLKTNPLKLISWIIKAGEIKFIELFWWISDFGSSTQRLIKSVILVSFFFAGVYSLFPELTNGEFGELELPLRFIRALYFSIVTTTTVGFGDISANSGSIISHIVIISHLLAGYTLLGALIVRLGIVFQTLPEAEVSNINILKENKDD